MFPTLIDFGTHNLPLLGEKHLFLPTYGFLFAGGAVLAWWWFMRRGRDLDVSPDSLFNLSFYALLAGIVGAKALLVLLDWRVYLEHPAELLGTLRSAGVLVGGVVAAGLVFTLYARRNGLPLYRLADAIVAPLALAQGIGRLGCFSAGCCWGVPAHGSGFSVTFTDPMSHAQTGVPLHVPLVPTQLFQMVNDLLLAAILTWLWRRRVKPAGTTLWIYVLLYSVGRGLIEFWRGDVARGLFFGDQVSTTQLFAAAGIVVASVMLLRGRRIRRDVAQEVAP